MPLSSTLPPLQKLAGDDILLAESCIFRPGEDLDCTGGVSDGIGEAEANRNLAELQQLDDLFPTYDAGGNRITPTRYLQSGCDTIFKEKSNNCGDDFSSDPCKSCSGTKKAKCLARKTRCKLDSINGLRFPFLEDLPSNLKLLSGGDVQIVDFSPPEIVFGFDFELPFVIWTPPTVTLTVSFGFSVTVKYGVVLDTKGIREAIQENDPLKAFNSLAFKDTFDGVDLPLVVFQARIGLDAAVSAAIVNIGVSGGIIVTVTVSMQR